MTSTIFDKTAIPFDGTDAAERAMAHIAPVLKATGGSMHAVMVLDQYVQNELERFSEVEHLTVDQTAQMACERLVATIAEMGIEATFALLPEQDVVDGVVAEASTAGCTSVALPTHSMNGVTRWLTGNLRDKMVKATNVPVLVIPPAD